MKCVACGANLDSTGALPGGTARCACGAESAVPMPADATARTSEAAILKCPACGGPCSSDARACPHCEVELAAVRCPHCFALHFAGSRFCARCGRELEPEPLLDATKAPCPRCNKPLSLATGTAEQSAGAMHECIACGGLFLDNKTLDALLAREADPARRVASHPHDAPAAASIAHPNDVVRYVKCPICQTFMNRVNFGRRSGVVVDVCKKHGTWFDAGELTQAIEFVATGGLEETKRRDTDEAARQEREARVAAAEMKVAFMREGHEEARSLGRWTGGASNLLDLLFELLR